MKYISIVKLIAAIGVSELAGIIGAVFTASAIPTWYAGLAKPELRPPNWLFGPVWTTLYALMGIALYLIWMKRPSVFENADMLRTWKWAIAVFVVQLVLNTLWSVIFFGLRSPGFAFGEIILLWLSILATIILFAKISPLAGWLLAPYILWVTFASYLNYAIWTLN